MFITQNNMEKVFIVIHEDGVCIYACCDNRQDAYKIKDSYPDPTVLKVVPLEINNTEKVFIQI